MLPAPLDASEEVRREVARVVSRLSALGPARTRSGVVAPSAQRLADLATDAEGVPRRPVPALAPHGWADLLVVLVGDLLRADPDDSALGAARDELVALRRGLA